MIIFIESPIIKTKNVSNNRLIVETKFIIIKINISI